MSETEDLPEFYVVTESDGYETFFWADDAVLVPTETLDAARLQQCKDNDTEKVFKHGGSFPCISIYDLIECARKHGELDKMMDECRGLRKFLDENPRSSG